VIGLGPTNIGGGPGGSSTPATTEPPAFVVQTVVGPTSGPGTQITAGALVFTDTTLGTASLITPGSGVYPVGTYFGVTDDAGTAATNNIYVGGASVRIQDPNTGAYSASATIQTNGQTVWWVWGPTGGGLNGWKCDTPTPPVGLLANGAADAIVAMNHAGTAPAFVSVAGDGALNGSTGALTISKLGGVAIAATATLALGTADQVLAVNHAGTAPVWTSVSGDCTANAGAITITKIGGVACSPLATLANAAADQVLGMNHGATAPAYFTVAGDLSLASGSFKVVALSGTTPIPITPNELQWVTGAAPKFSQTIAAAAATPAAMTFACQLPNAASTTLAANTPSGYAFVLPAPNALTVAGAEAYVRISRTGGTGGLQFGTLAGGNFGAIYSGDVTPSNSNYLLNCSASQTVLNTPSGGSGFLFVGGAQAVRWMAAGVQIGAGVQFGGGQGVIGITDRTTAPTTNPSGGGVLYSEAGALKWRGSSGTVTVLGPA
jgi:hypothetical protein